MHFASDPYSTGAPRFKDAALRSVEVGDGALAAWRAAWRATGKLAPSLAEGHFAAGFAEADGGLLVVDRFATESLCYRIDGDEVRFAPRADVLAGANSPVELQSLYDYLYFHEIPSPRTVFSDVRRLPPGHAARIEAGNLVVRPYWQPRFAPERAISFSAARDEFRRLLFDAVRRQLDGTPPAAFLSGGTDSSTVAGMLREVTGRAPQTYSIGFDADGYDEMAFARVAARHFKTDHREYYVTPDDLVQAIPTVAAHHDQPFGNSSALPAYICALRAREQGVTRMLAGDGGDELFGGNTRYAKQKVFGWYEAVPASIRSAWLEPMARAGWVEHLPPLRKLASYVRQASVPMPNRMESYNLLDRIGLELIFESDFLANINPGGPADQQRDVWAHSEGSGLIDRMLAFDWRYTLAENDLPKVRSSCRLAGISVGYPLLDQTIVDFSARLPAQFKLKGLTLRWFFKEALRGFLPDEIIRKKKHGFGLPFGVWAIRHTALNALASESLRGLGERGLVRPGFIRELLDRLLPEHPGYYGEMVWILMMLEQWFRHHRPDYRLWA